MSRIRGLLAALGMALISLVPILGATSSASADPGTILKFDVMTPVTGPYMGTSNPIWTVPGGGLPWIITAGTGSLTRDGHVLIHVRGLVLADEPRSRPSCGASTRSPTSWPSSAARPSAPVARPLSPMSAPASSRRAPPGTRTSTPGLSCLSRALPHRVRVWRGTSAGSPRPAAEPGWPGSDGDARAAAGYR
jgi:hypothetical protein